MILGEAPPEAALAEAPAKVIGKVETDMFCPQCHYNLHGLDVRLDPRLDIAIVRCPECGKFSPAGVATGAGRIWLHRLATFLIILWVGVLVLGFATGAILFFSLDMLGFDGFMQYEYRNWNRGVRPTWIWRPATIADFHSYQLFYLAHFLLAGSCLLLGFLFGAFLGTFLWHIRQTRHLWTLAVPIAATFLASSLYFFDLSRYSPDTPHWALERSFWIAACQLIGLIAGIWAGRPFARLLLCALLTKRILHYLRFLWEIDGKIPPGTIAPAGHAIISPEGAS